MISTVDGRWICQECGSSSYLLVDGKESSLFELYRMRYAPKKIEWHFPHALWCTSLANRMSLIASDVAYRQAVDSSRAKTGV